MNGRWRLHADGRRLRAAFADVAIGQVVGRSPTTTASDWLPTFEFGLANDSSCVKRPVRVSGAEGRFTLKLDARQSSSRWQPPALNVDRPTAAFEASELSLSTQSGIKRRREAAVQTDPKRTPNLRLTGPQQRRTAPLLRVRVESLVRAHSRSPVVPLRSSRQPPRTPAIHSDQSS